MAALWPSSLSSWPICKPEQYAYRQDRGAWDAVKGLWRKDLGAATRLALA
jgi:hypothetical protein